MVPYKERNRLNFQTMFANGNRGSLYELIASGIIVHLQIHRDIDFCYSITTVLSRTKKAYKDDGEAVLYFNFPKLGIVVPLWQGDLLFLMQPNYMPSVHNATRN